MNQTKEVVANSRESALKGIQLLKADLVRRQDNSVVITKGGFPLRKSHFVKKGLQEGRVTISDSGIVICQNKTGIGRYNVFVRDGNFAFVRKATE